jgi:UDP-N-acetylmuramate dehydrogenase
MDKISSALPIRENIPLAPFTTLGVGGPARFFIEAKTEDHILRALEFAQSKPCPVFVLGGGSNLVVSDAGFPGLVIKIELSGFQCDKDTGRYSVAAGVEWDSFVQHSVDKNLAGIECLSGIPGTVGGAPIQNIGAYGEEVSEVITGITALDRASGRIRELSNRDCQFSYRTSLFNTTCRDRFIIMRIAFALRMDGLPRIHYPDLQKRFAENPHSPSLAEVRKAVLQARRAKAMVVQDGDPDTKSAGSFFKNPLLEQEAVNAIEAEACKRGVIRPSERIPRFPVSPGREKVPAAWLIEHSGFRKGYVYKNAGLSSRHALAIVNRGGATAQDILDLMHLIQTRVRESFGIELHPEPVFIGFENASRKPAF